MPETENDRPVALHSPKVSALAAALCVVWAAGAWGWCRNWAMPLPVFVWFDVALVHLLGALFVALLVVSRLPQSFHGWLGTGFAFGLLAMAVGMAVSSEPLLRAATTFMTGFIVRMCVAFPVALSSAVLASTWLSHSRVRAALPGAGQTAATMLLALASLVLLPWSYVGSRCEYQVNRLREILEQYRLVEGRRLAGMILILDPAARMKGDSLRYTVRDLERQIRDVQQRVTVEMPDDASEEHLLERARDLAILDRPDEASELLRPLLERPHPSAAAGLLQATILQTGEDWEGAIGWYEIARRELTWEGPAIAAPRLEIAALRGTAYCERKLGRYPAAQASYRRLLEMSPSAETHFLLAQFYEDTQQASLAAQHARRAMALSPRRYKADGERMIDRLVVRQFGCLSADAVASQRRDSP